MLDSPHAHVDRPPLRQEELRGLLVRPGSLWRDIVVVPRTGSTNADLAADVRDGAREGKVLVAEAQFAGRGRLGRQWSAPPRSGLTFSVVLRPQAPVTSFGWLPLLAGVAVAHAVRQVAKLDVRLKWPNDLLINESKLGGILVERVDGAVIVGMGLNVSLRREELPVDRATSLLMAGAVQYDRELLLRTILEELERRYRTWIAAGGDAEACGLRATYLECCATVGREVRVELPGERILTGRAIDVDVSGHLQVRSGDEDLVLSAGEVVHVRGRT